MGMLFDYMVVGRVLTAAQQYSPCLFPCETASLTIGGEVALHQRLDHDCE